MESRKTNKSKQRQYTIQIEMKRIFIKNGWIHCPPIYLPESSRNFPIFHRVQAAYNAKIQAELEALKAQQEAEGTLLWSQSNHYLATCIA